jgi:hypothetical protein
VITVKDCPFKTKEDVLKVLVEHPEHSLTFNFTAAATEETSPDSVSDSESISSSQSSSASHFSSSSSSTSSKSSKSSNQFKITSIHQITGQERIEIAKTIILEYAGSSKAYRLALIAMKAVNIASEEVYRKIVEQYRNKEDTSVSWEVNLKSTAASTHSSVRGKKLNGW